MFSVYGSLWSSYCTFLRKLKKISIIIKYLRKMLILHDDQSSAITIASDQAPHWGKYKAKKRRRKGEKTSSAFPPSYSTTPIFVVVLPCFLSFSPLQSLVQGYSYNDERHRPEIYNLESFPKGGLFGILIQTLGTVIYINPA